MTTAGRVDVTAPRDARALIGMHTRGAKVIVAVYLCATMFSLVAVAPRAPVPIVLMIVGLVAIAAGTIGLLAVPGDPIPMAPAIAMAAAGPVGAVLVLTAYPTGATSAVYDWTHGLGTTVMCFMCVRGRPVLAWMGMCATMIVYAAHSAVIGESVLAGPGRVAIDLAPLIMATVFSLTLRPSAKAIFDLREAGARRVAELAARAAVARERDEQVAELDRLVRPMLNRIASGDDLDDADREACRLLEAQLRDRLRAPRLVAPDLAAAARRARSSGVEVILLDDGVDLSEGAMDRIRGAVIAALESATAGDVRVRLLPAHRSAAASVIVRSDDGVSRTDFDHEGRAVRR